MRGLRPRRDEVARSPSRSLLEWLLVVLTLLVLLPHGLLHRHLAAELVLASLSLCAVVLTASFLHRARGRRSLRIPSFRRRLQSGAAAGSSRRPPSAVVKAHAASAARATTKTKRGAKSQSSVRSVGWTVVSTA